MNTGIQAALIAASTVLLAACASNEGMTRPEPQTFHAPDQVVENTLYMAAVERAARRRGVTVHWFNPPTKRVDRDDPAAAVQ